MGNPTTCFFLHSIWRTSWAYSVCLQTLCERVPKTCFPLHALVGTFAILRPSQNPTHLQITYRSPPQARKPGILRVALPSLLKLCAPARRPSDCLTVERGAGPRNAPRAPPPAGARASRGHKGPLPKAAADWLLARSTTRAFRDGADGGGSTTSHGPVNGVWGTRSVGWTERAGTGHSGTGLGTAEAAPRERGAERGRGGSSAGPSLKQDPRGAGFAHALRAAGERSVSPGLSMRRWTRLASARMRMTEEEEEEEGERRGSGLVRVRVCGAAPLWEYNTEGEKAVIEMAGSSPACSGSST